MYIHKYHKTKASNLKLKIRSRQLGTLFLGNLCLENQSIIAIHFLALLNLRKYFEFL